MIIQTVNAPQFLMQYVRESQIYFPAYFMDLNISIVHIYNELFIIEEKTYIFACGERRR